MPRKVRRRRSGGKYHVAPKPERTYDGIVFHSKGEMKRYIALTQLQQAGEISHLQRQVRFPLLVNGDLVGTYVADFVYWQHGVRVTEDVKGAVTASYALKRKLMLACHGIRIHEVKAW